MKNIYSAVIYDIDNKKYYNPFKKEKWFCNINDAYKIDLSTINDINSYKSLYGYFYLIDIDDDLDHLNIDLLISKHSSNYDPLIKFKNATPNYLFSYSEFLIIKSDFKAAKNKKMIHYLMYSIIKGKSIDKTYKTGFKKFNKTFEKILNIKNSVNNDSNLLLNLSSVFPYIDQCRLNKIINELKLALNIS